MCKPLEVEAVSDAGTLAGTHATERWQSEQSRGSGADVALPVCGKMPARW